MIHKITFEIETITPMFLSGADQSKAELRAASIKGLLRFWWRALHAEPDIENLRKKEASIFGSSDEGMGGAKFSIRVTQPDKQQVSHFNNPGRQDPVGYMFYSTFMQRERQRPYFPEGSRFKIIISSKDEGSLKVVTASLWLLVYLGGLGTRSRRGAGNMVITNIEDTAGIVKDIGLDFIPKGSNSGEVAECLKSNFKLVQKQIANNSGFVASYSNLCLSRFVISKNDFNTWREALGATGFKRFRDKNKLRIFDTAAFGFPIIHRTSHTTVTGKAGNEPFSRRGSPLIFKVIKSDNKFYWMVIRLAGELLPVGGVISANRNTQKADYGIIDEFWVEIKESGEEHIFSIPTSLQQIKDDLIKQVNPQKVILFGSKARGDFHSHSDTDIAIEADKPLSRLPLQGAIDIVDMKKTENSLKQKIEKEGVVIYERKG